MPELSACPYKADNPFHPPSRSFSHIFFRIDKATAQKGGAGPGPPLAPPPLPLDQPPLPPDDGFSSVSPAALGGWGLPPEASRPEDPPAPPPPPPPPVVGLGLSFGMKAGGGAGRGIRVIARGGIAARGGRMGGRAAGRPLGGAQATGAFGMSDSEEEA